MIGALATLFFAWTAFGLDARELGDLDSEWYDTIGREFYSSQSVS